MSNSAEQLIYKAALLLDESGDVEAAEEALRDAIGVAEVSERPLELIQAKTLLGELLLHLEREDEALVLFEDVLEHAQHPSIGGDVVELELRTAREHLARAQGPE